jgi:hypothetical protein
VPAVARGQAHMHFAVALGALFVPGSLPRLIGFGLVFPSLSETEISGRVGLLYGTLRMDTVVRIGGLAADRATVSQRLGE